MPWHLSLFGFSVSEKLQSGIGVREHEVGLVRRAVLDAKGAGRMRRIDGDPAVAGHVGETNAREFIAAVRFEEHVVDFRDVPASEVSDALTFAQILRVF